MSNVDSAEVANRTVLRSPLAGRVYVDDDVFERERQRIFKSLWIFVGMAQLLSDENAYLTRTIGGVPVVVQRLRGRLRAFANQCLHRQMPLQWDYVGNRSLICKYHGWTYSDSGCVRGIPNQRLYEFSPEQTSSLCLREYALEQIGNLLFVCVDDNPPGIDTQFSQLLLQQIENASSKFDWEVAYAVFDVPWNWKLNFENVLDGNHVQFVHPKTFFPLMQTEGKPEAAISANGRSVLRDIDENRPIHLSSLSYAVDGPMAISPDPWSSQVDRYGDRDHYYNWFIYPNVNFCSVHGKMFLIQQFVPKSPSVTEYHLWVTTATRTNPTANFSGLLWSLIKGEKSVVDEDALALSQLQEKMMSDGDSSRHGAYEAHIVRMHRWYAERLGL